MAHLPLIAVTMGDPAGIGPEVVVKALADDAVARACRIVVFGDDAALRQAAQRLGMPAAWQAAPSPDALAPDAPTQVCDLGGVGPGVLFASRPSPEGGAAALRAIEAAAAAARDGRVAAIATAPIHKQAIALAGSPFAGHTDMLADICGAEHHVMMLVGGPLRVALVTHHIALADVPHAIGTEEIVAVATTTAESLRRFFAIPEPRVAVCGLNPHASDGSRFGDEELRIIEPAVVQLRHAGIPVAGPVSPDTCFRRAAQGEFHAVVAMYHDQGLIPLKLIAFDEAVNVTLGLPIIRTSVGHGTAYDIAGRGIASHRSMVAAILLAARMAQARDAQH